MCFLPSRASRLSMQSSLHGRFISLVELDLAAQPVVSLLDVEFAALARGFPFAGG
jgi:hypothetical protein